jgi:hypothetical protein
VKVNDAVCSSVLLVAAASAGVSALIDLSFPSTHRSVHQKVAAALFFLSTINTDCRWHLIHLRIQDPYLQQVLLVITASSKATLIAACLNHESVGRVTSLTLTTRMPYKASTVIMNTQE